jgi:hypothetical protein
MRDWAREAGRAGVDVLRRVHASITVDAPPQRVWDLYADVPGSASWVPFVEEVLYVSGPPALGQVYRERTRLAGVTDTAEWRVIEWDPPRRQVQVSTDKRMNSRLVIEIERAGHGSRIRQQALLESRLPRPLSWAHELVFAVASRHGVRQAVRAAKAHLERDPTDADRS